MFWNSYLTSLCICNNTGDIFGMIPFVLDEALGERRPPWPRLIITHTRVLISQFCRIRCDLKGKSFQRVQFAGNNVDIMYNVRGKQF